MIDWQPIETAPRDGTRILTYAPKAPEYGYEAVQINYWEFGSWQRSNSRLWPPTRWARIDPPEAE